MPLFGKNKKNNADADGLEVTDKSENDKSEINVKKWNPFTHLKKKARVMFKLRLKRKDSDGNESEVDSIPGFDFGDDNDGKKEKQKKPKKEKPKKEKKQKEPKAPKEKKAPKDKSSGDGDGDDNGKVKPITWIIIALGAVAVGTAAFLVFTFVLNQPSVEEQLIKAQLLRDDKKYAEAYKLYEKLLKKDDTLVTAHIACAEILHEKEETELAIKNLTAALEPTDNDPKIQQKINELTLASVMDVGEPPDAEAAPPEEEATSGTTSEAASAATSGTTAAPPVIVTFSDPVFENMIRLSLGKEASDSIMSDELSQITSLKILGNTHAAASKSGNPDDANNNLTSINRIDSYTVRGVAYTERGTIRNLNDLKHFTNLKKLVVAYNSITDISGISELKTLNTVGLYCNEIADITPLSSLDSLEYLYIYNNHISDLSPLSTCTKMRQLWLNENNISDISALKDFNLLNELFLTGNQVRDISAVAGMTALKTLHFDNNQVADISPIKDLAVLNDVSFLNNPVTDQSPASHIGRVNQSYY